jgi:HSP20 family protein
MAEEKSKELVTTEAVRSPMTLFDLDKWFNEALLRPFSPFGLPRLRVAPEEVVPAMDLFEDNGNLVLKAELPGIKKEDIEITLTGEDITISGEKRMEKEIKRKDYYKMESSYGSFCRTFSLPKEVQADQVKSTFKDGILEVIMPKSAEAKNKEVKVKIE